ncbi:MAG: SRPBCC domain-containing protein [Pseudomonadota bacterium]
MPRREATFTVNAPPGELWKFLRDFESLCTCIPGVESIQVLDRNSAELTVKEKVGVIPMIVNLKAKIESEDPPHKLHAVATAEHLTMAIDVALRETGAGTELTSVFDVKGTGQLKAIVDRLFEKRATERTAQFAECLGRRFGAAEPERAPTQPPAGWFRRLWQRITEWFRPSPK